ncbi:hypothetical protein MMC25_002827 [Agyrium rufum]|nr:hypothetical protein [Agyrium rufum]
MKGDFARVLHKLSFVLARHDEGDEAASKLKEAEAEAILASRQSPGVSTAPGGGEEAYDNLVLSKMLRLHADGLLEADEKRDEAEVLRADQEANLGRTAANVGEDAYDSLVYILWR